MATKGQTIDAIKVGLGIDATQLKRDLAALRQQASETFELRPKLVVNRTQIDAINKEIRGRGDLAIRIPVRFTNKGELQRQLNTLIGELTIPEVTIPVRWGDPGAPPAGASGGAPPAGGGGGAPVPPAGTGARGGRTRPAPSSGGTSAPATGGATAAGAVAAGTVAGSAPPRTQSTVSPGIIANPRTAQRTVLDPQAGLPRARQQQAQQIPTWDSMRGWMLGGQQEQDLLGRTIRSRRDPVSVARDEQRARLFMHAWTSGDVGALEGMFPGMGEAITNRSPGQMRTAFLKGHGGKPQNVARRLTRFGEGSRQDVGFNASEYPLEFAFTTAAGSLNSLGKPFEKKAGGLAAVAGGATPSKKTYSTPEAARLAVQREAETVRYPEEAYRYLQELEQLRRHDEPMTEEAADAHEKAEKEAHRAIAAYERAGGVRARVGGSTLASSKPGGFAPPPQFGSKEELAAHEQVLDARRAALDAKVAGLKIDYGSQLFAGPMSFSKLVKSSSGEQVRGTPYDVATREPIEASMLDRLKKGIPGFAGGGLWERLHGHERPGSSLQDLDRLAAEGGAIAKVGEQGPEYMVQTKDGVHVVPRHQMSPFMRMVQENRRNAFPGKDMSGYQVGGTIRFRGPQGRFEAGGTAAARAVTGGLASTLSVQRVFVVNMPQFAAAVAAGVGQAQQNMGGIHSNPAVAAAAANAAAVAGGVVGPATSNTRIGGASPAQKTLAKFAAQEAVGDLAERLDRVGIGISESLQKSPVRALSVALGQIAQTVVGGRAGILERSRIAANLQSDAGFAVRETQAAQAQGTEAQFRQQVLQRRFGVGSALEAGTVLTGPDRDKAVAAFQDVEEAITDAAERIAVARPEAEKRVAAAEAAEKAILTPGQQVRAQAVGLAGIVGGTLLFTAAMSVAQQGLSLLGKVSSEAGDRIAGFGFTLRRVAEEMAPALRQSGLAGARGAIAEQRAAIGLPTSVDLTALTAFSRRLAGAQNFQSQTDLLRAERSAQGIRGLTVPGIGSGFGNGLFGTFINQTPGAVEQLSGRLKDPRAEGNAAVAARLPLTQAPLTGQDFAGFALSPFQGIEDFAKSVVFGEPNRRGLPPAETVAAAAAADAAARQAAQERAGRENVVVVKDLNASIKKLTEFTGEVAAGRFVTGKPNDALARQTSENLKDIGASDEVRARFEQAGIGIVGNNGQALAGAALNRIFEQSFNSTLVPALDDLLTSRQRAFSAQIGAIETNARFQRDTVIPAQFAEQLISRPFPTSNTAGVVGTQNIDPTAAAAAGKYADAIGAARGELDAIREQGLTELRNLGVPQEAIDSVTDLGAAITGLRTRAENLQLDVEQAQYNEQIFQTKRGISDLIGLNGRQQAGASRLGILQRQQIEDGRELSRIQLARSQRELNLQLAIARLQAPGETPEERAIRRREAILRAREQQRELDIGKSTTERGFKIEDIGFARGLRDAVKQLDLIQQARSVSVEVRGINRIIEAKEQLLSVRQAFLGVARDAGIEVRRAGHQLTAELESVLGRLNDEARKQVRRFVNDQIEAYEGLEIIFPEATEGRGPATKNSRRPAQGSRVSATGFAGLVGSPTTFTAGDAGGEAVFVLRNPRTSSMPAMGGMGGGVFNFNISIQNQGGIGNEADEDRLVRKLTRRLHDEVAVLVGTV
jgi:hypothetical protein